MRSHLIDLGLFLATAAVAYFEDSQVKELIWGLWLSSLTVGYSIIVYSITCMVRYSETPQKVEIQFLLPVVRLLTPLLGLFMLVFFTVHFGGFHIGHAVFLNSLFPLIVFDESQPAAPQILLFLRRVAEEGWPLVAASVLSSRAVFAKIRGSKGKVNFFVPYLNVIRMHLMIFILMGAHFWKVQNRFLALFILFFYFFPWRSLSGLLFHLAPRSDPR